MKWDSKVSSSLIMKGDIIVDDDENRDQHCQHVSFSRWNLTAGVPTRELVSRLARKV